MTRWVTVAVAIGAGACAPDTEFRCDDWADCGPGGACEPAGACSFADPECSTGRRYSALAPGELAGECAEDPQRDGACDADTACERFRECIDGRCLSVHAIAAGRLMTCAHCSHVGSPTGGPNHCWGTIDGFVPPIVARPPFYLFNEQTWTTAFTIGDNHACIRRANGWGCAGLGTDLQLGDRPADPDGFFPIPVAFADFVVAGPRHTCSASNTQVSCWGRGEDGQLDGTPRATTGAAVTTTPFPGAVAVTRLGLASRMTCIGSAIGVACWGDETASWPGGTFTAMWQLAGLTGIVTDLAVGGGHGCAIVDEQVVCWGNNDHGQAAPDDGAATVAVSSPLPAGVRARAVAAGDTHSCAITIDGEVWCWGDGALDRLAGEPGPAPVQIHATEPPAVAISAGIDYTCAVHADDLVRCWGNEVSLLVDDPATTTVREQVEEFYACDF